MSPFEVALRQHEDLGPAEEMPPPHHSLHKNVEVADSMSFLTPYVLTDVETTTPHAQR